MQVFDPARGVSLEETSKWLGRELPTHGVDEVSRNDVRRKLEVYCFDCPLYSDDLVAQAHGYRATPAPVVMTGLWAMPAHWAPGQQSPFDPNDPEARLHGVPEEVAVPMPFARNVQAASEAEYFEPLYPGDRLHGVRKLVEITPKQTRLGNGAFFTFEGRHFKQSGELVSVTRSTGYRYDPDPERVAEARGRRAEAKGAQAEATSAASSPTRQLAESPLDVDWSRQVYFEDAAVGTEMTRYGVFLSYQRIVMSVMADRMFSPLHHSREYARGQGLADVIFNTKGYDMVFEITLRRWMGLGGRVRKMGPFRMTHNTYPGDILSAGGRVESAEIRDGEGLASLELWAENQRGEAARGKATVVLPRRG
jgi:3-methylfumaryl-CoA hydratase